MVVYRYGVRGPEGMPDLEIELQAFLRDPKPEIGGLGKAEHFWNVVSILWPEKIDGKKNPNAFIRNPWSERMAIETIRRPVLAVLGPLNSSKTDFYAVWGLVSWMADPWNTMVLLTSTSLGDSKRKMWSSVKKYFQAVPKLPGRLIDSKGSILTDDGSGRSSDKCGIILIAGEKKKEKEAVGKLIGMKMFTGTLLFICDELPELSPALNEAFFSNLQPSNPKATMVGIGNFNSIYDALGTLSEPIGGWGSVSPDDEEWECVRGAYCIRFDGMKSPNLLLGEDKYPFLYSSRSLAKHREAYGENSAPFWRMCRSFPCPIGAENVIYNETDLVNGHAESTECLWRTQPILVSAMDPSFTSGGDRSVQMIGSWGLCTDGVWRLRREKTILLREDVRIKVPRDYQIARQFRDNCIAHGVNPYHAALDTTAGGSVLWSIICEEWDNRVLAVNFSGAPTDMYVRANDTNTARMQFDRRVTELWCVGRDFMKYDQLRGIDPDLARELKARQYETVKGPDGLKVSVEKKEEMKKRLGFSPDMGDCYCVMLDLCRQRLRALAGGVSSGQHAINDAWQKRVNQVISLYENVDYAEEPIAV